MTVYKREIAALASLVRNDICFSNDFYAVALLYYIVIAREHRDRGNPRMGVYRNGFATTFVFYINIIRLPYFVMLSLRGNIVTVAISRQGRYRRKFISTLQ